MAMDIYLCALGFPIVIPLYNIWKNFPAYPPVILTLLSTIRDFTVVIWIITRNYLLIFNIISWIKSTGTYMKKWLTKSALLVSFEQH